MNQSWSTEATEVEDGADIENEQQHYLSMIENLEKEVVEREKRIHKLTAQNGDPIVKNINLMKEATRWKISSHVSNLSTSGQKYFRIYNVKWNHIDFEKIFVEVQFQLTLDDDLTANQISELDIRLSCEDETLNCLIGSECKQLISLSCSGNNPQLFFEHFKVYLELHNHRITTLESSGVDFSFQCDDSDKWSVRITIRNEYRKVLAVLLWSVGLYSIGESFEMSYLVRFTSKGLKLAQDCNIPEDLIEKGTIETWTPQECLKNLCQMASFE